MYNINNFNDFFYEGRNETYKARPTTIFTKPSVDSVNHFMDLEAIKFYGVLGAENADAINKLFLSTVKEVEALSLIFILEREGVEINYSEGSSADITTEDMLPKHIQEITTDISSDIDGMGYIRSIKTNNGSDTNFKCNVGLKFDDNTDDSTIITLLSRLTAYKYLDDKEAFNSCYAEFYGVFKAGYFLAKKNNNNTFR